VQTKGQLEAATPLYIAAQSGHLEVVVFAGGSEATPLVVTA